MNSIRTVALSLGFVLTATVMRGQNCPSRLLCPSNVVADCQSPQGADVAFSVTGTNNCFPSRVVCAPPSGSFFPVGTNRVCCDLQIAQGAVFQTVTQCCFEVVVKCPTCTTPPVVLCPRSGRIIRCAKPEGARLRFRIPAFDECDTNLAVVCVPSSGSLFPPGTNVVTCCTTNDAGLSDCCSFNVVVLTNDCYLPNPSFELASGSHPPPGGNFTTNCIGWYQWTNTPDLLWGMFIPNNPFGYSFACHGSNYANIQGGYFGSGVGYFDTEALAGNFTIPLTVGRTYCLSACVSLADYANTPGFHLEFFLANSAGVGQILRRITVTNRLDWSNVTAVVTATGPWDRIIIRSYDRPSLPYNHGACFFDNVKVCCCPAVQIYPGPLPHTVCVVWHGNADIKLLQANSLDPRAEWRAADMLMLEDDFDEHRAVIAIPEKGSAFFRTLE